MGDAPSRAAPTRSVEPTRPLASEHVAARPPHASPAHTAGLPWAPRLAALGAIAVPLFLLALLLSDAI